MRVAESGSAPVPPEKSNHQARRIGRWGSRVGIGVIFVAAIRLIALVIERPRSAGHDLGIFLNVMVGAALFVVLAKWIFSIVLHRTLSKARRMNPGAFVMLARVDPSFHTAVNELASRGFGAPLSWRGVNLMIAVDADAIVVWHGIRMPAANFRISSCQVQEVRTGSYTEQSRTRAAVAITIATTDGPVNLAWGVQRFGVFGITPESANRLQPIVHRIQTVLRLGQPAEDPLT